MMSLLIRKRTVADLDACVEALAAVYEADRYPSNWPADPARWLTPADQLDAWISTDADAVTGHAVLRLPDPEDAADRVLTVAAGGPVGILSRLFVTPRARGTGAAMELVKAVEKEAIGRDLRVGLDVISDGHRAIALYERAGWQRVGSGLADWTTADGERAHVHYYLR